PMLASAEPEVVLEGNGPLDRQICEQIRSFIAQGALRAGEELPTVRALAVGLAVNPGLVGKAYAELERAGLVTTAEGSGTFVAAGAESLNIGHTRNEELVDLCRRFVDEAQSYGVARQELLAVLEMLLEGRERPW